MVIVISIGIGFVGATLLTLIGWRIQIEGRAFQCNDWVPLATFTTDMTGHRQAGDTLSPGWAWEDIERVGRVYQIVFWLLWVIVAGLVTVVGSRNGRRTRRCMLSALARLSQRTGVLRKEE